MDAWRGTDQSSIACCFLCDAVFSKLGTCPSWLEARGQWGRLIALRGRATLMTCDLHLGTGSQHLFLYDQTKLPTTGHDQLHLQCPLTTKHV